MSNIPLAGRPLPRTILAAAPLALLVALVLLPLTARASPTDVLPPSGPYGTVAVPFAPAVPGAAEALAAAYLRADGRAVGALLAAVPGAGYDADAALAAFAGGTPGAPQTVLLNGRPFPLLSIAAADGGTAYVVAFTAVPAEGGLRVSDAPPEPGATHVVARAEEAEAAAALAAAVLDHLGATATLAYDEAAAASPLAAPVVAPNPFAASTTLRFTLPTAADVELAVFDALGRRVAVPARGRMEAGSHGVAFDAAGLAPGVYVVRLVAGGRVATARLTRR